MKYKLMGLEEDFLRSELRKLPEDMRLAIILRFWHSETIESISKYINLPWDQTNHLIEEGLKILREGPLKDVYGETQMKTQDFRCKPKN